MAGIACEFYIPDCSHSSLFSSSYVRCQKSQGHKILRCFPHCCPSHVHYRNCGTSLALAVTRPPMANTWYAFIVFERADQQLYNLNDVIIATDIATQTRTRENPLATHLRGMVADNGHFRFDEKQADGWHYGWKSGRSKVQREIQHVARAYIFEEIDQLQWKVVGTATSAPFTIVSYRGEHNKRKKSAIQLLLPSSPNPNEEPKHIHYAMIFQYLCECRLDNAPRDLIAWFEGLYNKEHEYGVTLEELAESIAREIDLCTFPFVDNFFARFIAQIREAYIVAQQTSPSIILKDINSMRYSMYDGTWFWQSQSIQYHQLSLPITAEHYFRWLSLAPSFYQRLISNSLYIRSTNPSFTTVPSQFDLDTKAHSLRLLPDGESCMANLAIDYVGYQDSTGNIHLMLYIFERPQFSCLMANVAIVLYDEQTIVYSVDLKRAMIAPDEPDFLDCEPSRRVELCNSVSSASHGSFKVTYCRMMVWQFYMTNCPHAQLFQPSYVRCQKSQGQKILRCFPHCCPRHIHYRNCGSSICLAIPPTNAPVRAVVAFTLQDEETYCVGTIVPASEIVNELRTKDNPFALYLEGTQLGVFDHQRSTSGNIHFRFDEKQAEGWHYGWKSGRSKAQRELQHVLRAYVFEEITPMQWKVIGMVVSTPFTIVSYRGEHNKRKKNQLLDSPPQQVNDDTPQSYGLILNYIGRFRLQEAAPELLEWLQLQLFSIPFVGRGLNRCGFYSEQELVHRKACLAIALAMAQPDFLYRMDQIFLQNADAVLDKSNLQHVYYECLIEQLIFPIMRHVLRQFGLSVQQVVQSITKEDTSASMDGFFTHFVAQMRESFIMMQGPPSVFQDHRENIFDGTWTWQKEATQIHHSTMSMTLTHYLRFLANATSFTQRLCNQTLYIRSSCPSFSTIPSELVLNHQAQSLRVLPDGESCMGTIAVDYIGSIAPSGELHFVLYFYERLGDSCVMAQVTIHPQDDQTLVYSVTITGATASTIPSNELFDQEANIRVEQYEQWPAIQTGSFQLTYSRYKILRCFPHCCPGHVHYRNCGSFLYLSTTANDKRHLIAIVVFAPDDNQVFQLGDNIHAEELERDIRTRENPFGLFVKGHQLKDPSGHFRFDEKQVDGWHYAWLSGRSKAQRQQHHVLRAFVLEVNTPNMYQVVGTTMSTPFTIVSYRGEHNKRKKGAFAPSSFRFDLPQAPIEIYLRVLDCLSSFLLDHVAADDWKWFENSLSIDPLTALTTRHSHSDHSNHKIYLALGRGLACPEFWATMDKCFVRHASCVLHQNESQRIFRQVLEQLLMPMIDKTLHQHNTTIVDVANTIALDIELSSTLLPDDIFALFVAQLREAYIAVLSHSKTQQNPSILDSQQITIFNGKWIWQRQATQILEWTLPISLPHYLRWFYNSAALEMNYQNGILSVNSIYLRLTTVPSEFIADNCVHSLRVLPTGESCMGQVAVDYLVNVASEIRMRLFFMERTKKNA
ncbi:hypothetical protein THRCLA_04426 [Thraustotheca clavata]|uniref:Uncharacterized protein n=1 Tax=Thraustotheca clavata TaxID=74557 RepID=A0A1V9ZZ35_9STRA|nr:hypothetical protein THRCLA_04426 [Thraustotheca clavata]